MRLRLLISGAAAGMICGLFGAGGGMVLIPMLIHFCGMDSRQVFATAISVMLPVSLVSIAVLWLNGNLVLQGAVPYLTGGVSGGILAGLLYKKIPTALLHRTMGILILWGGLRLIWNG